MNFPAHRCERRPARRGGAADVIVVDGREVWLESRYDPEQETARLIGGLGVGERDICVLVGFGPKTAGHLPFDMPNIILLDPVTARWDGTRRPAALCASIAEAEARLARMAVIRSEWFNIHVHPAFQQSFPDYSAAARARLQAAFERRLAEQMTAKSIGLLATKNILRNLPRLAEMAPVRALFGACKSGAAVVVGGGPSLDRSAPLIHEHRGRFYVIATDTAARPLLAHGVSPDAVVTLDPRPESAAHLAGVIAECGSGTVWIAAAQAEPSLVEQFPPERSAVFAGDHPLECWLARIWGDPGNLAGRASVILPCFDLAVRLGCSPIFLAGADFSFGAGGLSHSKGTSYYEEMMGQASRWQTIESLAEARAEVKAPRTVDGLRTGANLLDYKRLLEEQIAACGRLVWQMNPALPVAGARAAAMFSFATNLPIREISGGVSVRWSSRSAAEEARRELGRALKTNAAVDERFRPVVESLALDELRKQPDMSEADALAAAAKRAAELLM